MEGDKMTDDIIADFENLIQSRYGQYWKNALHAYLQDKVMENPTYIKTITDNLVRGLHKTTTKQEEHIANMETLAISALHITPIKVLKLKKNKSFFENIKRLLPLLKKYKKEDLENKIKNI